LIREQLYFGGSCRKSEVEGVPRPEHVGEDGDAIARCRRRLPPSMMSLRKIRVVLGPDRECFDLF